MNLNDCEMPKYLDEGLRSMPFKPNVGLNSNQALTDDQLRAIFKNFWFLAVYMIFLDFLLRVNLYSFFFSTFYSSLDRNNVFRRNNALRIGEDKLKFLSNPSEDNIQSSFRRKVGLSMEEGQLVQTHGFRPKSR
ncbi:hypothetical protein I3842_01G100900 [Carya illinoinensis]|uniref:Uncharacterized protein n=1 Tax=Carya illinoinensis TaxID=32201 RepID=A0A922KA21_CARIL|nr:hypothetical protein I3842_01G100900 [Carya illinoinensis]